MFDTSSIRMLVECGLNGRARDINLFTKHEEMTLQQVHFYTYGNPIRFCRILQIRGTISSGWVMAGLPIP